MMLSISQQVLIMVSKSSLLMQLEDNHHLSRKKQASLKSENLLQMISISTLETKHNLSLSQQEAQLAQAIKHLVVMVEICLIYLEHQAISSNLVLVDKML